LDGRQGIINRLPYWLRGCLAGNLAGSVLFVVFIALFTLTPLSLAVAVFATWGASGAEVFRAYAIPAALLGAWVGGLFGIPIGTLAGRVLAGRNGEQLWSIPGWLTGAIVTAYIILPNFLDPTTRMAGEPVATRLLVFAIMAGFGAVIGFVSSRVRRRLRTPA
jgi:hypothetical protein